jgi:hypothetical protein
LTLWKDRGFSTFQEEIMKFSNFIDDGKISAGMKITIENDSGSIHTFWVGDCTPYHEPSDSDGGFGWDDNLEEYGDWNVVTAIQF